MSVPLDRQRLDRELALRGLTARELAALAGVGEATISRARNGRTVTPATMRKLAVALTSVPVVTGAADIIGDGRASA